MTMYGPSKSPEVIATKALERKKLLERIRRQRAQAYQALREKRRHLSSHLPSEED